MNKSNISKFWCRSNKWCLKTNKPAQFNQFWTHYFHTYFKHNFSKVGTNLKLFLNDPVHKILPQFKEITLCPTNPHPHPKQKKNFSRQCRSHMWQMYQKLDIFMFLKTGTYLSSKSHVTLGVAKIFQPNCLFCILIGNTV